MQDLMQIIKGRRSIRRYREDPIPEEALTQVLESVRWAPSWNNTQCWELIVIRDKGNKAKLQEIMPTINPARKALLEAPVVIALCGKLESSGFYMGQPTTKFGDWFMFDLGIAVQNLCLTAHALGLGTVIAGLFDHEKAKALLKVPEGYEVVALIPLGYPAQESSAPKRRGMDEFIHHETFIAS